MSKKKLITIVIVILLCTATYYGYQYYQHQEKPLTLYGNVDTRSVNIGFRVSGRLASLNVDEGDEIKEGQMLGKLDAGPYLDAMEQARANVASAKARLSLLEAGYRDEEISQGRAEVAQRLAAYNYANSFFQRQQKLWKQRLIPENTLEDARATRDQAQAALQSAKDRLTVFLNGNRPQQIEEAQSNVLQYEAAASQALRNVVDTTLFAPSDGVVLTRAVEPGTLLNAGATVLTLSLTKPVWVRAYVGETQLGKIVPGAEMRISTDSHPDTFYRGKVGFISPSAEFTPKNVETPDLRTDLVYRLRIIVIDPDDALRQGMPVTLHFTDDAK
ncbi:secretion protein HlyD [Enterobacillus tribolii]|uniref:HlyD family secretion protein n=1 Tax=Enterobacillus tribolii TaxID=1487935 RepID=A0A370QEM2_9GAMM|nr:secretion protein HlyD [Enterobacillus tribolii]MBW7984117.1 secretion protein HlyD [Enterobacillus tribolii]RDK86822.1 HlyD family secretion protein [Enterobacillus tribolii]